MSLFRYRFRTNATDAKYVGDVFVTKSGNDTTGDGTVGLPYLTIKKGIADLAAGDTLSIGAGTYKEDSGQSLAISSINCAIAPLISGTAGNLITIQSAIGDEGLVIIDANSEYTGPSVTGIGAGDPLMGILLGTYDYIKVLDLVFENCNVVGIASDGGTSGAYTDNADQSQNCIIENCVVDGVHGITGNNIEGVRFTNTVNWEMRNIKVLNMTLLGVPANDHTSAFLTFRSKDAIMENCEGVDGSTGLALKGHWTTDGGSPVTEIEARYNKLVGRVEGFYTFNHPGARVYLHHNFIESVGPSISATIRTTIADATADSMDLEITSNTVVNNVNTKQLIDLYGYKDVKLLGNIFYGGGFVANIKGDGTYPAELSSSDYNLCSSTSGTNTFKVSFDVNIGTVDTDVNLAAWQAVPYGSHPTLNLSTAPDANSAEETSTSTFVDLVDYQLKGTSAGVGMMSDGSDVGMYQTGSEIIGTTGWVSTYT